MASRKPRKERPLNVRQKAFVDHYAACGNATQAARLAGYNGDDATLAVTGHDLLKHPKVAAALEARTQKTTAKRIATAQQIQELWTEVLNSPSASMADRLKASELLAKTQGQFIKKVENSGKVEVRVVRDNQAPAALQPGKDNEG
jgi:phage terminase small subunit